MVQEDASRLGVAPQPQSPPHPEWPASIKWRSFQTVCFAPEAGPRSAAAGGRSPPRYWCRLCREGGFTTAALQAHAKAAHLRLSDAGMRSNRVGAREVFERHPRPLYLPLSADPTLAEPERDPVHSVVHPEASAAEAEAARAAGPGGPAWDGDAGSGAGGGSGDAPQLPGENGENVEEDEESENKPLLLEPAKGFPEPPRQRRMMPSSGDPEWPPGIKWRCQGTVPFYPEANPVVPRSDTHWCRVCGRGGLPVGSLQNHAKMHHRDLTSLGVRVSAGLATWEAGPRPLYLPLAADPTTRPPGQTVVASCPHPDASDAERAAATAAAAEGLSAGSDVTKAGAQAAAAAARGGPAGTRRSCSRRPRATTRGATPRSGRRRCAGGASRRSRSSRSRPASTWARTTGAASVATAG
ncbi:unnamed protein product [Pedinophyceae sp. YPF-701]|nr:unnamed protein product [Pedinophyceae sp. YPF-701]